MTIALIAVGAVALFTFLFVWCLCVAAAREDEFMERALQERRMRSTRECEARSRIQGGGTCGWRHD